MSTLLEKIEQELGRSFTNEGVDQASVRERLIESMMDRLLEDFNAVGFEANISIDRTAKGRQAIRVEGVQTEQVATFLEDYGFTISEGSKGSSYMKMSRGHTMMSVMDGRKYPSQFAPKANSVCLALEDVTPVTEAAARVKTDYVFTNPMFPQDSVVARTGNRHAPQYSVAGLIAKTGMDQHTILNYVDVRRSGASMMKAAKEVGCTVLQASDIERALLDDGFDLSATPKYTSVTEAAVTAIMPVGDPPDDSMARFVAMEPTNPNSALDVLKLYAMAIAELLPQYTLDQHNVEFGEVTGNLEAAYVQGMLSTGEVMKVEVDATENPMNIGIHIPARDTATFTVIYPTYVMGTLHTVMQRAQEAMDTEDYKQSDTGNWADDELVTSPNADKMIESTINEGKEPTEDELGALGAIAYELESEVDVPVRWTNKLASMPDSVDKRTAESVMLGVMEMFAMNDASRGKKGHALKTSTGKLLASLFKKITGKSAKSAYDKNYDMVESKAPDAPVIEEGIVSPVKPLLPPSVKEADSASKYDDEQFAQALKLAYNRMAQVMMKESGKDMMTGKDIQQFIGLYFGRGGAKQSEKMMRKSFLKLTKAKQDAIMNMAFPPEKVYEASPKKKT